MDEIESNDVFLEGEAFYTFINEAKSITSMPEEALYGIYSQSESKEFIRRLKLAEKGDLDAIETVMSLTEDNQNAKKYWYQKYIDLTVNDSISKKEHLKIKGQEQFENKLVTPYLDKKLDIDYEYTPSITVTKVPIGIQKILNYNNYIFQELMNIHQEYFSEKRLPSSDNILTSTFIKAPVRIILSAFKVLTDDDSSYDLKQLSAAFFKYILAVMASYTGDLDFDNLDDQIYLNVLYDNATFDLVEDFQDILDEYEAAINDGFGLIEAYNNGNWSPQDHLSIKGSFFNLIDKILLNNKDQSQSRNIIFSLISIHIIFQVSLFKNQDMQFKDVIKAQTVFLLSTHDILDRYKFTSLIPELRERIEEFWEIDLAQKNI
jgi:hypothetical protein